MKIKERIRAVEPQIDVARMVRWVADYTAYVGIVLILVLAIVFAPALYSPSNLTNVVRQAAILGVVAVGQTLVLLGRGFDLSVGAVMGLTATIVTQVSGSRSDRPLTAVLIALLVGLAVGASNGWLVVRRNVPPFVATLGMLIFLQGMRLAYTRGAFSGTVSPSVRSLAVGWLGPLPLPLLIWAGIVAVAGLILYRSFLGRWLYATGANPIAAKFSGVPTGWVVFATFLASGGLAVMAGTLLTGYTGYVDQYLGSGVELDSITAAIIGGTSFAGGKGGLGGTVAGVLLLTLLVNLVVLLNLSAELQLVVKGVVLIVAVGLQGLRLRVLSGATPL